MSKVGEIIAIGGGGFGRNPNNPIIEKHKNMEWGR